MEGLPVNYDIHGACIQVYLCIRVAIVVANYWLIRDVAGMKPLLSEVNYMAVLRILISTVGVTEMRNFEVE